MNKPLLNKTIVITRNEEQSESALSNLEDLGARILSFPTIKIIDIKSYEAFDSAIKNFNDYNYLIFTSANSVTKFCDRLTNLNLSINYSNIKIVVTGSKTAEACREHNIRVDLIPNNFTAKNIIEDLQNEIKNKNILIPCSAIARIELSDGLLSAGGIVTKVSIYDVGIPDELEIRLQIQQLNENNPDVFVFTSPSTFKNFLSILNIKDPKNYFKDYIIAAIGTTTESAINKCDIKVDIVPDIFTLEAVAEAIVVYFEKMKLTIQ